MKLNVGSGPYPAAGWVNVDAYHPTADVQASITALPFDDETAGRIYLGHVLEHLPWPSLPAALTEIRRVLRPGGTVIAVGPCMERAVLTGQPPWLLRQIVNGEEPDRPGAAHQWTPTELLTVLAMQTALDDVRPLAVAEVRLPDWPNRCIDPWQCAVAATRLP